MAGVDWLGPFLGEVFDSEAAGQWQDAVDAEMERAFWQTVTDAVLLAGGELVGVWAAGARAVSVADDVGRVAGKARPYAVEVAQESVHESTRLSWNEFLSQVGGYGYSQKQISRIYRKYLNSKGINPTGQSMRLQFLGATPGKSSPTGRAVIERMRGEGRILETHAGTFVKDADGIWHPLAEMDMGHSPVDAVRFWNSTGIEHGPRSSFIRHWMLDPNNYELIHFSRNRSLGAQIGETYISP